MRRIKATELAVGMDMVEADGGLLTVLEVKRVGDSVVVTLASMMQENIKSYIRADYYVFVA